MTKTLFNYLYTDGEGKFASVTYDLIQIEYGNSQFMPNVSEHMRQEGWTEFVARRQALGIQDRNQWHVLEGDIVRFHNVAGDNLFLIESDPFRFRFTKLADGSSYSPEKLPAEWWEVVGNRFENPELLVRPIKKTEREFQQDTLNRELL